MERSNGEELMEVNTRARKARNSCQLLSLHVLHYKINVCKLWDWKPARSEFLFWADKLGTQKLWWESVFAHLFCQFLPACLQKILLPLTFQLSFKEKSLSDTSWRLLLMFLSQLMMCLSSASPALWHLCHVCLHLVALCRLLCLSNTFGSACSPNRNVRVSVQNPEIKNGCKQIQLVLTRNTIKSTCWGREHTVGAPSVCAALCTWKHRFLAFLSSETASGSSRRGKHQQFVECRVGTERHSSVQATFMFCFEVSVCYSLASLSQPFILVPSCEESCRGRGTLALLQLLWEQGCLQRGLTPSHSLSSLWKHDLYVTFMMGNNNTGLQMAADVHETS